MIDVYAGGTSPLGVSSSGVAAEVTGTSVCGGVVAVTDAYVGGNLEFIGISSITPADACGFSSEGDNMAGV